MPVGQTQQVSQACLGPAAVEQTGHGVVVDETTNGLTAAEARQNLSLQKTRCFLAGEQGVKVDQAGSGCVRILQSEEGAAVGAKVLAQ